MIVRANRGKTNPSGDERGMKNFLFRGFLAPAKVFHEGADSPLSGHVTVHRDQRPSGRGQPESTLTRVPALLILKEGD